MNFICITFGCKVNQYESEAIAEKMSATGFNQVQDFKIADVVVINSCSVTAASDSKVRKSIHKVRRENPDAIIVLTGCMVQVVLDDICSEVDIVCGNAKKLSLIQDIKKFQKEHNKITDIDDFTCETPFESMQIKKFGDKTRAFVKIEDGCNRFCSYCIIPYARGRVRSKKLSDLQLEIESLAESGYKEIVLVGIDLSCYGQDLGVNLCDAVELVCGVNGIERVRLSSLEPECFTEETIVRLSRQEKLCPHFHLSLQSGAEKTLKRMNRHYTPNEYEAIVKNIRNHFKDAAITTDVMVGFPGESEEDFTESVNFVKKINFASVHVFAYSRRPGTRADIFPDQISENVKHERSKKLLAVVKKLKSDFYDRQIGKIEPVLFEVQVSDGLYVGHTKNYIPVHVKSDINLHNQLVSVKLTCNDGNVVVGEILK